MLVLALEFSRDSPARGTRPRAADSHTSTGAYGASGRRATTGSRRRHHTRGPRGRSLKTEERGPGRHDLLDPVTDGLPAGSSPKGGPGRSLAGERGGLPSVGGWP